MLKPILSVGLAAVLSASVLVAPAGAQTGGELCNGLVPTIVGTSGNDVIRGTSRDDVIFAGAGNDQIRGASGSDVICGGDGNDTIYGDSQRDVIFGDAGNDVLHGGSDADEVHGGDGNDEIYGNSQSDRLFGNAGNDTINGGPDADTLDGGPGNDILNGSFQNDTCSSGEETLSCENLIAGDPDETTGPMLLSETDVAWLQGASEWVNLMWTTDTELRNVEVRVTPASGDLSVEYPSNADRSRLSVDTDLSVSEIDFTAVRLTTVAGEPIDATVEISWDDANGQRQTNDFALSLTNQAYEGDDFAILTQEAWVGTDSDNPAANWIDLDYRGLSPQNSAFRVTVDTELPVHYPQGTYTSLHHDELLRTGETDVARIWFDPELIADGTSTLVITVDYVDANGIDQSIAHRVALTIG